MQTMSLGALLWRAVVVLILVAANAFFVAAEFALVASRRTRLQAMAQRGDTKAKLAQRAVQSLDRYISGTQLGITVSSIGLGWIGEPAVAHALEQLFAFLPRTLAELATHGVATVIAFAGITFLHIVLGELTPKALALLHPEATSRWVAGPLIAFTEATNPFIWALNGSARAVLKLLGARPPTEVDRVHQPEEIVMLVKQTERSGRLDKEDVRMIEGVFEFTEKSAKDVMTPRTDIVALPDDTTIENAADQMARSGRSRYPVYRDSLDDVIGFVHVKQILSELRRGAKGTLGAIARELLYVPGSREVEDVLADMKRHKTQMAIVLDEFGGTAGLVTMEDLLEEIVGEIEDEYDRGAPVPHAAGSAVTIPGAMELEDANERFGLGIAEESYHTVGGFVFGMLGRLPVPGDRVPVQGGVLEVVEMDGRRVGTLKLERGS